MSDDRTNQTSSSFSFKDTKMSQMKDTGVPWIGIVPVGWSVIPLKKLFVIYNGSTPSSNNVSYWDGDINWITPSDMSSGDIYITEGAKCITQSGFDSCNLHLVDRGDIILSCRAPIGSVKIAAGPLCTNQGCKSLVPKMAVNTEYYYYYLWCLNAHLNSLGRGTTFMELSTFDLSNLETPFPTIEEQKRIASFLNIQCELIDCQISAIEESISKLEDLKQSIIYEAVTKGLEKNVELKDSGVPWMGSIPDCWDVKKLKAITSSGLLMDGDWIESPVIIDSGIRYLTTGNVGPGYFKEQGSGFISERTFEELNCLPVYPGDLVASRLNEPIGRACIIPEGEEKYVVAVDVTVIRAPEMDSKYLMYCMNCPSYSNHLGLMARGTTMHRISRTQLSDVQIPVPDKESQFHISSYLDRCCNAIYTQIGEQKRLKETMIQFKQSLIYEYVTGKKQVPQEA